MWNILVIDDSYSVLQELAFAEEIFIHIHSSFAGRDYI